MQDSYLFIIVLYNIHMSLLIFYSQDKPSGPRALREESIQFWGYI